MLLPCLLFGRCKGTKVNSKFKINNFKITVIRKNNHKQPNEIATNNRMKLPQISENGDHPLAHEVGRRSAACFACRQHPAIALHLQTEEPLAVCSTRGSSGNKSVSLLPLTQVFSTTFQRNDHRRYTPPSPFERRIPCLAKI